MLLGLVLIAGCAHFEKQTMTPVSHEKLPGYLASEHLPDSVALLPVPPATGSSAFALDQEISQVNFQLRGSLRWELAVRDADLSFPTAVDSFSCALGVSVKELEAPHLFRLLRRTLSDVNRTVSRAKNVYNRPRPFMVNGQPFCTPDFEAGLRKSGSYPSGHTATGWAWALILSEIAPERADALLQRGRAFGQSRVVCNVHWQSDVDEGRTVAAAVVARLHAEAHFRSDLEAAVVEFAAARANGLKPMADCKAEAAALALFPWLAPGAAN
ncbi:MAG: phosphatase PAP2 family protein [Desulfuromonadales bacterium]|nr:phosphatase PAP2 family protein [Desulfuromonadales bacterium]